MSKFRWAGVIAPGIVFLIFVVFMILDYIYDPFDASLEGIRVYGHNGEGVLYRAIPASFVELIIFYGIMRPSSWRWTIGRPLIALIPFAPWWVFSMFITMHAGGVVTLHFFWVTLVLGFILLAILGRAGFILWNYIFKKEYTEMPARNMR